MKKRTMIFVTAMVLLFAMVTGATIAYMTDESNVVTNTFTYGNITIYLDETDIDGSKKGVIPGVTPDGRDAENEYKILPSTTYTKDPVVRIAEGSEECYIFVKVENGFSEYEDSENTIASQMAALGWKAVDGKTDVFYYAKTNATEGDVLKGGDTATVFNQLAIGSQVNNENIETASEAEIIVKAYAVQSQGFNNAAEAWSGAPLAGW